MSARGRICFHVPYLYPLAVGRSDFVGGIEVQDWFLARALAQRGFDVAVATCDFGQPPVEQRDGVTFLRTYSTQAGLPGVRFFYPRLWKAMRALRRARADVVSRKRGGALDRLGLRRREAVRSTLRLPRCERQGCVSLAPRAEEAERSVVVSQGSARS